MILRDLHVQSFRALRQSAVHFGPGLNVVRGPNEAGKSTLQTAIVAALFTDPGQDNRSIRALRTWGSEAFPVIRASLSDHGHDYELTKDFEAKQAELLMPDGSRLRDRGRIEAVLAEITGVAGEKVYRATACLTQQQWAQLSAGGEVREMLQATLSGGAENVTARAILQKLEKAVADLERGVKRVAPVNPGPLATVIAARQKVAGELAEARQDAAGSEQARLDLQRSRQRLDEISRQAAADASLKERVERYQKLDRELGDLRLTADQVGATLERIGRLEQEIAAIVENLDQGPQIPGELAADITRWRERQAERDEELRTLTAEVSGLEAELETARQDAREATSARLPVGLLEQATRRRSEADAAAHQAADQERVASETAARISAAQRRLAPRGRLVAAGIAGILLGCGVAVALRQPGAFALAALGLGFLAYGLTIRPPVGLAQWPAQLAEAQSAQAAQTESAQARESELAGILASAGCEDLPGLARAIAAQEQAIAEQERSVEAKSVAVRERRRRVEQTGDLVRKLGESVRQAVRGSGLGSAEAVLEQVEARAKAQAGLRDKRQKLEGALRGQTREELDRQLRELATGVLAREQQLEAPDLQMARLSPEGYQSLLDRIAKLEEERQSCEDLARKAQAVIGASRHDADSVAVLEGRERQLAEREMLVQERLAVLTLTRDVVARAQTETAGDVTRQLGPRMGELVCGLTAGRYCEASLDSDMRPVTVSPDPVAPPIVATNAEDGSLSCATREQLYLAARLAIVDLLWPEGGPPLLMDDPLVNFDPLRRQAALEALRESAQTHQVIVFTCGKDYDFAADRIIDMPPPAANDTPPGRDI